MDASDREKVRTEMKAAQEKKDAVRLRGHLGIAMYVISVLCPPAGFVWMIVLLLRDNLSDRMMGAYMCATTTGGGLLYWLIWKAWGVTMVAGVLHDLGNAISKVALARSGL